MDSEHRVSHKSRATHKNFSSRGGAGSKHSGRRGGGRSGRGGPSRGGRHSQMTAEQRAYFDKLVKESHIPEAAARRVVYGKATLNEVLEELMLQERIERLISEHGVNRALATNIALGKTNLDVVLLRRRKNETLKKYYDQSCLEEARRKDARIALALHGNKKVVGRIKDVDKYVFRFQPDDSEEVVEIHKTHVKFAYDPDQYKGVRKHLKVDKKVRAQQLGPILRARERYHFKNLTLQESMDTRREVDVVTLEGDTFRGHVEWFGRWEFGLKLKGGARVVAFRHAVYRLTLRQK